jgi:hypothetical protein
MTRNEIEAEMYLSLKIFVQDRNAKLNDNLTETEIKLGITAT